MFLRVLPQTVPFKCLNRGHKISNYTQYMLEVTIKHNEKLKFTQVHIKPYFQLLICKSPAS